VEQEKSMVQSGMNAGDDRIRSERNESSVKYFYKEITRTDFSYQTQKSREA